MKADISTSSSLRIALPSILQLGIQSFELFCGHRRAGAQR